MANPSLQIGNGKFAIKENELLGYSSSGTRFFPIPITMTRATLGSRVNPSGLIEDVELLGSELIQDSDFLLTGTQAENVTGTYWTTGAGWSISGGKATLVAQAGSSSLGSVVMSVTPGKTYKVTVNVSATSTGFRLYDTAGVVSYGLQLGKNVFYTIPSSSSYQITPLGLAGASGIIDNISVKEATIDGLARVDYTDGTGSLLVEPQRTNLYTYSEDFLQSYWTKLNCTAPLTSELAPDGTTNSVHNLNGTSANLFASGGATGVEHTISFYIKSNGQSKDYFKLRLGNNTSVEYVATNDWIRYEFTSTPTTGVFGITTSSSPNNEFDLLVWGAQSEQASYATSYIKTQGSSVTRNKDEYTKTGISDKINSEEGVLFLEVAALSLTSTLEILSLSDGTYNNVVLFRYYDTSSNDIQVQVKVAGSLQASMLFTLTDATSFNKIAIKYKENDFALWVNGVEVNTDSSGTTFTSSTLNKLSFDRGDGSNPLFSKVRQLQVFKTALSDSELATLTTL